MYYYYYYYCPAKKKEVLYGRHGFNLWLKGICWMCPLNGTGMPMEIYCDTGNRFSLQMLASTFYSLNISHIEYYSSCVENCYSSLQLYCKLTIFCSILRLINYSLQYTSCNGARCKICAQACSLMYSYNGKVKTSAVHAYKLLFHSVNKQHVFCLKISTHDFMHNSKTF